MAWRRTRLLLKRLLLWLEWPMIVLGLVWLVLFGIEWRWGLGPVLTALSRAIWVAFVVEFAARLLLAGDRLRFLRHNWLTAVALLLPALRVLRFARALRALRLARSLRLSRPLMFIRTLGTANRGVGSLERLVEAGRDVVQIRLGVLPALNAADDPALQRLIAQLVDDLPALLEPASGADWCIEQLPTHVLHSNVPQRPADFLDEATMRMSERGLDMLLVVTDAALSSRQNRMVPGLPSTVAQIAVLSTRNLLLAPRNEPPRRLDSADMRWNVLRLAGHLFGHLLGLAHRRGSPLMQPFAYDPTLARALRFSRPESEQIRSIIRGVPEHEVEAGHRIAALLFHLGMTVRHPAKVFGAVWASGALLLGLKLPSLVTGAVAPAFVLIFTAEIWDVGFGMTDAKVIQFSLLSMAAATLYLSLSKGVFFPSRDKRLLTEHVAVVNSAIFFTLLAAVFGVFAMLTGLMLATELYFFPADLMSTWPTLDRPDITWQDKLRLAVFISGVGVTTGALAGGMESRTLIRHLALFRKSP